MDEGKAPADTSSYKNDIDIFLFSNGQVFSPPRKYHLKGEELDLWDYTKSNLARSHYGYMQSTLDLYTTEGKKVEDPSELADKTAYVAVEPNDTFQSGGYDQYLMKASQSWIKRYGDVQNVNNNSKEKTALDAEKISENKTDNFPIDVIENTNENTKLLTESAIGNDLLETTERKKHGQRSAHRTSLHTNTFLPKQTDKKMKPLQRSSILRKNIQQLQSNGKNPSSPLQNRKNVYENPKKIVPLKNSQQFKTPLSHQKSRRISSQLTFDKPIASSSYVTPGLIIPTKLGTIKNEIQTANDEEKEPHPDVITANDNTKQENITLIQHGSIQKDFGLETIIENINIIHNDENGAESKIIEPLTSRNVGDVINLRLSIEVKNKTDTTINKKGKVSVTIPLATNEHWNDPKEKSSQVNMDEMGTQMDIFNVNDDLFKNEVTPNYTIFNCDCCHNLCHAISKEPEVNYQKLNYQVKNINNKDYILILPSIRNDSDLFRCKCNNESKVDKYAQTSIVIENIKSLNLASNTHTTDQSTHTDKTDFYVNNVLHNQSVVSVSERKKSVTLDNLKDDNPVPEKESHTFSNKDYCDYCQNAMQENYTRTSENKSTSTIKINTHCVECPDSPKVNNDMNLNKVKENQVSTQISDCANILNENVMLDKSTQTDSHCFLLEARRQKDGHFSFHLPPLSMVKLYQM